MDDFRGHRVIQWADRAFVLFRQFPRKFSNLVKQFFFIDVAALQSSLLVQTIRSRLSKQPFPVDWLKLLGWKLSLVVFYH